MQNDYIKHTIIKSKMLNITVIIAITVVLVSKLFLSIAWLFSESLYGKAIWNSVFFTAAYIIHAEESHLKSLSVLYNYIKLDY